MFHKLPSYTHLKSFGCLCYASNLISHRMKFDSRSRRYNSLAILMVLKVTSYITWKLKSTLSPRIFSSMKNYSFFMNLLTILVMFLTILVLSFLSFLTLTLVFLYPLVLSLRLILRIWVLLPLVISHLILKLHPSMISQWISRKALEHPSF